MSGPMLEALLAGWWPHCLVINEYLSSMPGYFWPWVLLESEQRGVDGSRPGEEGVGWEVLLESDVMSASKKMEAEIEGCRCKETRQAGA